MSVETSRKGSISSVMDKYNQFPTLLIGVTRETNRRGNGRVGNAQLLLAHQYGTDTIPARRPLDVLKTDVKFVNALVEGVVDGNLNKAGVEGVLAVRKAIQSGLAPELAPGTLARRVTNTTDPTPLIDTGQLMNAITYVVRK